ncbi:MAG: hypothetical protein GY874_03015 [Desulfobacteraceae bacterium]|nr:hypothetical protein [Desulfobacteraceae bacterium]
MPVPRKVLRSAILVLTTLCLTTALIADQSAGPTRCLICGMDIYKYPHTRYEVTTIKKKVHVTCGVQCGLSLHLRLDKNWRGAIARDLLTNRPFDAAKGFYVFKSSVICDMAPGFIAFKSEKHASQFAKGFGGEVVTYNQALIKWRKLMRY